MWKQTNRQFFYLQGATTDRDGQKIKIFTKRDYRNLADI
jgi:hypothetical protein